MSKEITYEEAAKETFKLLADLLTSLKLQEGAIFEIFLTLPKPIQQYNLMEWLVDELKKRTPSEGEIMDKVFSMEEY